MHVEATGIKTDMDGTCHVASQRPASFSMVLRSGMLGGSVVSDGKTLVVYVPIMGKYTSNDAPSTLEDVLNPMNMILAEGGLPMGLDVFLQKDPLSSLEDTVESKDLGTEKVGDISATHIQLKSAVFCTDYWIADGPQPLILKETSTPTNDHRTPDLKGEIPKVVRTAVFSDWAINKPVDASQFQFTPPPGTQLVDEFTPQPPSPLVGKLAPDFELKDLKGKTVKLSDLRGKIVVLDFWATWCGPCVATLPVVSAVTEQRKDKDVVFYATNLKEAPDIITKFLRGKGLNPSVLLDSDGKVSDLYQAQSIPQSVVIGKDGIIQAVHIGYSPALKKQLSSQLDQLIVGKSLSPASTPLSENH